MVKAFLFFIKRAKTPSKIDFATKIKQLQVTVITAF